MNSWEPEARASVQRRLEAGEGVVLSLPGGDVQIRRLTTRGRFDRMEVRRYNPGTPAKGERRFIITEAVP